MIAIGNDHVGFELKEAVIEVLKAHNLEYKDFGAYSPDRANYPVYGQKVAMAVASGECDRGILLCGTGVGISIAANKVKGVRCVVCSEPYSAKLAKEHNNANILSMGARVVGPELAKMIVESWLTAEFQGGRHAERVAMLDEIENGVILSE
ncbi:MAG: ribose 5-phosphate isomerase B [Clostridia bacterium]|nr:ribose 5-phosphate isomerase B [Clostridia bacterium]